VKTKKIRGHKRRWNDIEHWIETHKNLDLTYLREHKRDYAKIQVHPWSGIPITDSHIPQLKGQTKTKILSGLIEIYDSWKNQLDKLGEDYYLKIWLFEPRFASSEVVCAIGEYLDFYENTFHKPVESKTLNPENYGSLKNEIGNFNWEYRLDEEHLDKNETGRPEDFNSLREFEENRKWFTKTMIKPHRTTKYSEPIGDATEFYSFKKGAVWLGEK
jgi:hypothetical protein